MNFHAGYGSPGARAINEKGDMGDVEGVGKRLLRYFLSKNKRTDIIIHCCRH